MAPPPQQHIGFLDALRGWAIFGVIFWHVQFSVGEFPGKAFFATGNYGVQLFFLLSALTICLSSYDRFHRERRPAMAFLIRRACRILPMWWMAIILHNFACPTPVFKNFTPSFLQLVETAVFANAYNAARIMHYVMGGWSIAVEMAAYLLLIPVLRYAKTPVHAVGILVFTILLTKVGFVLFGLKQWHGFNIPEALLEATGSFSIFFNAPAFAMGILLFFLFRKNHVLPFQTWLQHKVLMVTLVFSGLFFMAYHSVHYIPVVFIYSALFAVLVCHLWRAENKFIANRFTTYLGKISFSCYVWHFVVWKWLECLANSQGIALVRNSGLENLLAFLVLLTATTILTMLLSHFSYEWIESKGMNFGRWASGRVTNTPTKIQTA